MFKCDSYMNTVNKNCVAMDACIRPYGCKRPIDFFTT